MSATEECRGYACPPSTTVDLPECEHGWELGNGTAVCATQQPATVPLAATGGTVDPLGLALAGALLAAGLWLTMGRRLTERLRRWLGLTSPSGRRP